MTNVDLAIADTVADAIAGEIADGEYRRDIRSGTPWAGWVVGRHCGFDVKTNSGRRHARLALAALIKKGVLAVEARPDQSRHYRDYVTATVPQLCEYCGRGRDCDCYGRGV